MDSDTLYTASKYLNNLLLARGLLRNGAPLDFAKPTRDTRAQIINLVHDLLLRRDRDQDDREQVAAAIRGLRVDQNRKDAELEKLRSRAEEKDKAVVQAQVDTRNMRVELKKAEANARALQDQLARLKASVNQVKMQCSNDIRKRDVHIERLKTHLQGQQRGKKGGVVAPSIHISGGNTVGGYASNPSTRDLDDPEYSLKQETNAFLTDLSQSLSDENDSLIATMQATLSTMKELLGLPSEEFVSHMNREHDAIVAHDDNPLSTSCDVLTLELQSTMEILKTVLTSPNFVSMDEVELRDEEIARLREGWEKMEARWKEVLDMMNAWRTKMESTGVTIDLDELKKGLGLDESIHAPPTVMPGTTRSRQHELEGVTNHGDATIDDIRDSGLKTPPRAIKGPAYGTNNGRILKSAIKAVEPIDTFHQQAAKIRHMHRNNLEVVSPRKVAFVEADSVHCSELSHKNGDKASRSPLDNTPRSPCHDTDVGQAANAQDEQVRASMQNTNPSLPHTSCIDVTIVSYHPQR